MRREEPVPGQIQGVPEQITRGAVKEARTVGGEMGLRAGMLSAEDRSRACELGVDEACARKKQLQPMVH